MNSTGSFLNKIAKLNSDKEKGLLQEQSQEINECCDVSLSVDDCNCKNADQKFNEDLKLKRSENLRKLVVRNTVVPNLKAKMWASRLREECDSGEEIKPPRVCDRCEPRCEKKKHNPIQLPRENSWSVVGTDVEALFPSLTDIESGRVVRNAVMYANINFSNVDYKKALVYLRLVGGKGCLVNSKIHKLIPKWKGKRPDLVSIGGDKSKNVRNWKLVRRQLYDWEKREVISRVLEVAVITAMSTHVYSFEDKLYIQKMGGPIGMRSTASLANLLMKVYDCAWMKLARREGLIIDSYSRYVDDCRIILPSLSRGWRWTGGRFSYRQSFKEEDEREGLTDQQRTAREVTKAMCSLMSCLKFTAEESSMFPCNTLPTLDVRL